MSEIPRNNQVQVIQELHANNKRDETSTTTMLNVNRLNEIR